MNLEDIQAKDKLVYMGADEERCWPRWGGKYGYVVGTVKKVDTSKKYPIRMAWENGEDSCHKYTADLRRYTFEDRMVHLAAKIRRALGKSPSKKYNLKFWRTLKRCIIWASIAIMLDQLVLGGRLTEKIRAGVKKGTSSISKAIDKLTTKTIE